MLRESYLEPGIYQGTASGFKLVGTLDELQTFHFRSRAEKEKELRLGLPGNKVLELDRA